MPTVSDLHRFIQMQLPEYMLPSAFVSLEALPLTATGKVNRRALPPPEQTRPNLEQGFVAPRTTTEEVIVSIWAQLLEVNHVGIHDNFFELESHLLKATRVISQVRSTLQLDLPLRCLFEAPTERDCLKQLSRRRRTPLAPQTPIIVPLFARGTANEALTGASARESLNVKVMNCVTSVRRGDIKEEPMNRQETIAYVTQDRA